MSGETDGGLGFGVDLTITGDESATLVGGDLIAYIEGGFGKLSAGNVGSAVDANLGLGDLGFDGLGTDNVAEALVDFNDQGTLMYKGTFGDFTVAASYNMSVDGTNPNAADAANEFSVAAMYTMGDYDFGLGYDERGKVFTVKAGANVANFDVDVLGSFGEDDAKAYGLTVGYTMGATTVTAAYSKAEDAPASTGDNGEAYGIGVAYDLGGGAQIKGAIGEVQDVTVADLGIVMSF